MSSRSVAVMSRGVLAIGCVAALAAAWLAPVGAAARSGFQPDFLLINRHLAVEPVLVAEVNERAVTYRDSAGTLDETPLAQCIAMARPEVRIDHARKGMVQLADGQRLPGEAVSGAADKATLVWNHPLLGRVQVPLARIEWVVFTGEVHPPPVGEADVIMLANGDRLDGFITAMGDPITLETRSPGTQQQTKRVDVPLDRVVAARMVAQHRAPTGQRVWLNDGTILDVRRFEVGDDRLVRLVDPLVVPAARTERLQLTSVMAVQFDLKELVALPALAPRRVEGPRTRHMVRTPEAAFDAGGGRRSPGPDAAPLGLADLSFSGPLTVRYPLPRKGPGAEHATMRFAAEVSMPPAAREWGDCELVIRDDDREVARARLNADQPGTVINVLLRGSELSIEIMEGANGPIQDELVFTRAMLLGERR